MSELAEVRIWDWDYAFEVLPFLLQGLKITIVATALGMILAAIIGLFWAVARRSPRRFVAWPARGVVEFIRSTPLLVQLYFLFFVLPGLLPERFNLSALATGVIALGLHYSAYMAEVYRAGIDNIQKGQWEAAKALSLSRTATWRQIILPQAIPPVVPALGNYFVAMFKDTPLLSAITVVEVLSEAKQFGSENFRHIEAYTLTGLLFLGLSLAASVGIHGMQKRLQIKRAG